MKKFSMPLWYHPTTVLLLDDDRVYLDFLAPHIDSSFSVVTETDPRKALAMLKQRVYDVRHLHSVIQQNTDAVPRDDVSEIYNLDLSLLRADLKHANHFERSVVMVLDRHMPGFDGLELCATIRADSTLPVKLILLTGAATLSEAVDAFNAGKIDAYVEKRGKTTVVDQVNAHIKALAWSQFQEMSQLIVGSFYNTFMHIFTPAFCSIFEDIRKKQDIVQFYLLNTSGSFVLLNRSGEAKVLLVCSNTDFEMVSAIAEDSHAPQDVLDALADKTQYPLLLSQQVPLSLRGVAWREAMISIEKIENTSVFYGIAPYPPFNGCAFKQHVE